MAAMASAAPAEALKEEEKPVEALKKPGNKMLNSIFHAKPGRENWLKEADVHACEGCQVKFGLWTHKHHCRACGHIFCLKCVDFTLEIHREHYAEGQTETRKACVLCHSKHVAAMEGAAPAEKEEENPVEPVEKTTEVVEAAAPAEAPKEEEKPAEPVEEPGEAAAAVEAAAPAEAPKEEKKPVEPVEKPGESAAAVEAAAPAEAPKEEEKPVEPVEKPGESAAAVEAAAPAEAPKEEEKPVEPAVGEERRCDASDGQLYTRAEFVAEYGGTTQWEAAAPAEEKEK